MSNPQQTQQLTKSDRLEAAIDKNTTSQLRINRAGQVDFVNANEIMEFAKMMALAKQAIPPHLRENPGACLAVCIQSSSWQMSPFAVANKSYVVNDRMAYEAQIIAAVILMRAPIIGRLKYSYDGDGPTRRCTCKAKLDDGDTVEYTTPMVKDIKVKNSPLWVGDPDQQLGYSAARALARRHFPDVILGVYTPDEMAEETMRDVTPAVPRFTTEEAALPPGKPLESAKMPTREEQMQQHVPTAEQEQRRSEGEQGIVVTESPKETAVGTSQPEETGGGNPPPPADTDKEVLLADLNKRMDKDGVSAKTVRAWAAKEGLVPSDKILTKDYPAEALQTLDERWSEIAGN